MGLRRAVVNRVIKGVFDVICNIDSREFVKTLTGIPPVIVAVNHINFLEVPILVAHSYPLLLTGLVKSETWNNPIMSFLFDTYKAIPIDRTGSYREAFRKAREALDQGFFVCVAPEGTRSKNGVLGKGRGGIVQLALYTGAPVLPVVHFGGQRIWDNLRRFKRTPFYFKVGRPFRFNYQGRPDKAVREQMLAELMGQIARLLPEDMRGIYADQAQRESKYLEFI
ncbi:MAG: 1-acyl-sn-glycerol-3-phosphate acyltransferase [Treponema sp.]|jgi:1-acyl-sn-glycerol-3-phosphate acyltransferase|nr:1-acyl-sn-glycerol-3-phosphate acyltransferase [Treponema sp.]